MKLFCNACMWHVTHCWKRMQSRFRRKHLALESFVGSKNLNPPSFLFGCIVGSRTPQTGARNPVRSADTKAPCVYFWTWSRDVTRSLGGSASFSSMTGNCSFILQQRHKDQSERLWYFCFNRNVKSFWFSQSQRRSGNQINKRASWAGRLEAKTGMNT